MSVEGALVAGATASGPPVVAPLLTLTPKRSHTNILLDAEVAQSVEHSAENAGVVSSILTLGTKRPQAPHTHHTAGPTR